MCFWLGDRRPYISFRTYLANHNTYELQNQELEN